MTAAWAHCAAILPFVIEMSVRTRKTCLKPEGEPPIFANYAAHAISN